MLTREQVIQELGQIDDDQSFAIDLLVKYRMLEHPDKNTHLTDNEQ